jgi:alpha-tubulin suppressor-like RCC1 family protein
MIHARINGESFGLTIIEALSMNKPILSWSGGEDQNHSLILKDSGLLYNSGDDFKESLLNIREIKKYEDWTQRVKKFEPVPVMNKFREVFL